MLPLLKIALIIFDDWNVSHIARHEVVPEQVVEACSGNPYVSETYGNRVRVIGFSAGRILTVILSPKGEGVFYCVTARTADRKERRIYRQHTEGE